MLICQQCCNGCRGTVEVINRYGDIRSRSSDMGEFIVSASIQRVSADQEVVDVQLDAWDFTTQAQGYKLARTPNFGSTWTNYPAGGTISNYNLLPSSTDTCLSLVMINEIDLGEPTYFDRILLQEPIRFGQRIASFAIEARAEGEWMEVASGTTIGYKRLLRIPGIEADRVRIVIREANNSPALSNFGLFQASADEGWARQD